MSSPSIIETFTGATSYNFSEICEHHLLTSCDALGFNFSVRVDFLGGDISTGRVGVRYNNITAVIDESGDITTQGGPSSEYSVSTSALSTLFTLNTLGVSVLWERATPSGPPIITVTTNMSGGIADATVCGLCGNSLGQPVLRDLTVVDLSDPDEREEFIDDFFVNPGETFLREGQRPECGKCVGVARQSHDWGGRDPDSRMKMHLSFILSDTLYNGNKDAVTPHEEHGFI